MAKTDRCVVRNGAYRAGEFNIRERHNERKNENYHNGDIVPERVPLNVHFKSCDGTYEQAFNQMVEDGTISTHGLKKDPKVFDELVYDVNTSYFDRNGGYEYAKAFFKETYRHAVEEIGGEQFVLSAVMHADERNSAESERLGRDVFHYHLHVIYVPVVDKELKFRKNNKNPELVGKSKGFIKQVSHSKKWPLFVEIMRDGKPTKVNSYSLLQDRFFEHMKAAGYTDFERGERGSTAEHLTVLEYKAQQESLRAAEMEQKADRLEDKASTLDKSVESKQERLSVLNEKIAVSKETGTQLSEIDGMAKKTIGSNYQLTPDNWKTVSNLAKEGLKSRGIIKGLKDRITTLLKEIAGLKTKVERYGEGQGITEAMQFHQAKQRAPYRLSEVIADILRKPPEQTEPQKQAEIKRKRTVNEI